MPSCLQGTDTQSPRLEREYIQFGGQSRKSLQKKLLITFIAGQMHSLWVNLMFCKGDSNLWSQNDAFHINGKLRASVYHLVFSYWCPSTDKPPFKAHRSVILRLLWRRSNHPQVRRSGRRLTSVLQWTVIHRRHFSSKEYKQTLRHNSHFENKHLKKKMYADESMFK